MCTDLFFDIRLGILLHYKCSAKDISLPALFGGSNQPEPTQPTTLSQGSLEPYCV